MKIKPIVIVAGEPFSIFLEIFFKSLKKKKIKEMKNPIIIVGSKNLLISQMKRMNYKFSFNNVSNKKINLKGLNNKRINILNVDFKFKKPFDKISIKSKSYIEKCIISALDLIKKNKIKVLINGPISKTHFLQKKFPGMTEYFANKFAHDGKEVMLIFNKNLSVSPITTHYPLKKIFKRITIKKIIMHIKTINYFFKKYLSKKGRFVVSGLNPHCETTDKFSEDDKILRPAVKKLKKNDISVDGPYPADTLFLKKNIKQYDVVVGMYHDQVLAPIKALYGFNAINVTLGLPFIRVTPDHGTNNNMIGKNLSDPTSLIESIIFAKKISEN